MPSCTCCLTDCPSCLPCPSHPPCLAFPCVPLPFPYHHHLQFPTFQCHLLASLVSGGLDGPPSLLLCHPYYHPPAPGAFLPACLPPSVCPLVSGGAVCLHPCPSPLPSYHNMPTLLVPPRPAWDLPPSDFPEPMTSPQTCPHTCLPCLPFFACLLQGLVYATFPFPSLPVPHAFPRQWVYLPVVVCQVLLPATPALSTYLPSPFVPPPSLLPWPGCLTLPSYSCAGLLLHFARSYNFVLL